MQQRAPEGWLSDDVADQVERSRIEALLLPDRDRFSLAPRENGFERDVSLEHFPAAGMDVACGAADLGVGVRRQVLAASRGVTITAR